MILPRSYPGEYESPWPYHVIALLLSLTMVVNWELHIFQPNLVFFKKKSEMFWIEKMQQFAVECI